MAGKSTLDNDGVLWIRIHGEEGELPDLPLLSVTIRRAFNRIAWAELVIQDGDMATGKFEQGDSPRFAPGAAIRIDAGYGNEQDTLFSGIVVRFGVNIDGGGHARLVVECRDAAVKMTLGRYNANFLKKKDSDIISSLIGKYGLDAEVAATQQEHGELVQYNASDWDFMLARAEFNGMLVDAANGKIRVRPPGDMTRDTGLALAWGRDLYEFHADIDARRQCAAISATAWNSGEQAIVTGGQAAPVKLNAQGDLDGETLARVASPDELMLRTPTQQDKAALSTWASAAQTRAELARVRGRLACMGMPAKPGDLLAVEGVGARFAGDIFVSAVEHSLAGGDWQTDIEFGLDPDWHMTRDDIAAPAASGLLPGVGGLQIGIVVKLDGDPQEAQRIQIKLPVTQAQTEGIWARLIQFYASDGIGAYFLPEPGDEVIVGYLNDDPCHPVVLGAVYSAKRKPPYEIEAANDTKAIVTRAKHKIEFNEKDKILTITTPGDNRVVFDDKDKSILVKDQHDNRVKLSSDGIALDSQADITIRAKGKIALTANADITLKAQANVKAEGLNISCEAQIGFTGKGSATSELSSTGQTTVKGGMVMIN
ncbi:type VI secretion system tip protein VgrG [Paludibacterium paludis]|uniref:Type IV secretion protein Rhs n=1 Tax=Paludibacterium paludis TaxID=1225769 RepID=A0A918U9I3_9NEIS|nr:type VI secretion system tip protein VgrG [Paludibacterium paludis]GGY13836.1 type IV secretion protein Rhs [Paludibacterium paludis]